MGYSQSELVELGRRYLYPNYRQPEFVLVRGENCQVWDKAGRRYLDLTGGIAVNALGHAHPRLAKAIADQAATLSHVSNYFFTESNILLAERLCRATNMDRALFCNSGTEAIEASLKLVRRHFHTAGQPNRHRVVAFKRSFHGRTMGSLAATGQEGYRDGFGPLSSVTHVEYGQLDAVRAAMADDVAAILVEPIQGEGGVVVPPPGFFEGLRQIVDEHGSFLIADEIQTGIGRTGRMLAMSHWGVEADAVALAKGLGGGFPIGAMVCKAKLEEALPPGSHGTTFGGNPLASTAALTVLDVIQDEGLMQAATERGEQLQGVLEALVRKHPSKAAAARGMGLLRALQLAEGVDARATLAKLRECGLLVTIAGGTALRFSPPLVISETQVEEAGQILDAVLGETG